MNEYASASRRRLSRDRAIVTVAYVLALAAAAVVAVSTSDVFPVLLTTALADLVGTAAIFEFSRRLNNSSVYDPYWSVAPIAIAAYWWYQGTGFSSDVARPVLVFLLVFVWGVRLTGNWIYRWRGLQDEDWRYVMLRERHGRRYWIVSWSGIHLLPTVLVFLGCLPLYVVFVTTTASVGWLDALAALVTVGAIWIETQADRELVRFRNSRPAESAILESGLWRLSRHPNYLGEVLFWWGLFLFAVAAAPAYWWTGIGAVSITLLFQYISVPMIDERMLRRRPGYEQRMQTTPAMVPRLW